MTNKDVSVTQNDTEAGLNGLPRPPGPFIDMSNLKNQAAMITLKRFVTWYMQNTADEEGAILAKELLDRVE